MTTPEHLKTPADLLAEGRCWVLYRHPDVPPPITFGTDEETAFEAVARWNEEHGVSREEFAEVVASSISAENEMTRLKLKRDPHTGVAVVFDGNGDEILTLEEDKALDLYQQIARAYHLSHDEFCEECGCVLEGGCCPEGCDDEDEDED